MDDTNKLEQIIKYLNDNNEITYEQKPRNRYWKLTGHVYGRDCCSCISTNSMLYLTFPTLLHKEFNYISHTIYGNYKRSEDYYKQVKPIKLEGK